MKKTNYVHVDFGDTYVHLRKGKVARTREIEEGRIMVDEDKNGKIIGVEILRASSIRVDGTQLYPKLEATTTSTASNSVEYMTIK